MCGLCGIYDFSSVAEKHRQAVKNGISALKRRGPDGEGIYIDKHVALGHTRLAVIDTSDAASQPFTDNSGRYTIVFNGEFYNFREHRVLLEKKGYTFRSASDTEVLLYLYIDKGVDFLNEINGCFALAIYDNIEQSLLIARDRYGIKPLVYTLDNNRFIFASEIKALLPFDIASRMSFDSLRFFLALTYIPPPYTIFENVCKLMPGHYMIIKNGNITTYRYYSIKTPQNESVKICFADAAEKFRNLLEESVKRRLVSDVPLGTFLSGGIDSSVVTALASAHKAGINSYTVGYSDFSFYDESTEARIVSGKFNTKHTVFNVSEDDLLNHVTETLDYFDEPFGDSSAIAVSLLSRLTRNHVTVALSGDGADELHAGYNKHLAHLMAGKITPVNFLLKNSRPFLKLLPSSRNSNMANKVRQLAKYSGGLALDNSSRYWQWCSFTSQNHVEDILINNDLSAFEEKKQIFIKNISGDFNSVLHADFGLVLAGDMLPKVDLMSMSHGLEVRVPMLDHEVVDFVFSLPASFKIDKREQKKLLRHAFGEILPREILKKPKHGFEVPLLPWLRSGLKPLLDTYVSDEMINKVHIFDPGKIKMLNQQLHSVNPSDSAIRLWCVLVFQYWCIKHLH